MDWNVFNNTASQAVLDSDRVRELLDELGCAHLRGSRGDRAFRGPCPIHGGDGPNFQVRAGETLPLQWACWSHRCHEKYKPSLLGLVRGLLSAREGKDVNAWKAVAWLKRFLGDTPLPARGKTTPGSGAQPRLLSVSREQVRGALRVPSPYFVSRGFSPAVLDRLDVGHSEKLGRSVVPFYDEAGQRCIGYQARTEFPECRRCDRFHGESQPCGRGDRSKWEVLGGFPKAEHFYHYHAAVTSPSRFVLVVEGPGDVWAATAGDVLAVACLGHALTARQAELLAGLGKAAVVAFDNDRPGQDGARQALGRLRERGVNARTVRVPQAYHDVGSMPAGAVQEWLRRCGGSPGPSPPRAP